jgi:hypothetical protein
MSGDLGPKPSRRFSKRLVLAFSAAAWACIGWSIHAGAETAAVVVPSMSMLLAAIIGIYAGVGHADLRAILTRHRGND